MRRLRLKKKNSWWLAKRSVFLLNLAILALVTWGFAGEYVRHRRLKAEIERLEAEAASLEARNFEAIKLGERFSSDETLEREARLKLGLRKPGESVIILKDTGATILPLEDEPVILPEEGCVYLIDEYENSLGVNAINFFPSVLFEAASKSQFIITSHHLLVMTTEN